MRSAVLILALAALLPASLSAGGTRQPASADVVVDSFVNAWNSHDAAGFGSVFAEDADWVTAAGVQVNGREAIQSVLAREHATWAKTTSMTVASTLYRQVGANVVIYFHWAITGAVGRDGKLGGTFQGINLFVVARQPGGGWRVVAGQVTRSSSGT